MTISAVRREAIELLCTAQAEGRISVNLFDTRLAAVQQATSDAAIAAIVADLQDFEPTGGHLLVAESAEPPPIPYSDNLRISAVLSSTKREGNWVVPYKLELLTILGEMHMDFREAFLPDHVIDVDISVALGSLVLIVPKGTEIQNEADAILGSSEVKRKGKTFVPPNGLILRVTGRIVLGSLEIREK
ncbi:MAG TPA: LiaF domain-containing protein [Gemmatimonadales bacterium]|nr:LiaF domain-containing protein [Gemmatimonadales bacterium]